MEFVVFPQSGGWRWILRDGVEVVHTSPRGEDLREVIEDARKFKREIRLAAINYESKPWWPDEMKEKARA